MGTLDQVMNLKNQGYSDQDIVNQLQEQGVSPKDINDALGQARIKNAVSDNGTSTQGMEPSILKPGEGAEPEPGDLPTEGGISDEDLVPPTPGGPAHPTQEIGEQDMYQPSSYSQQQQVSYQPSYQSAQEYAPEQSYYQYQYAPQTAGGISDTDTMIEIAEQVFAEKSRQLQKKIDDLVEFKTLNQVKIDDFSNRLKRIEAIIDDLQTSILEKVGMYGKGLENVKKEMNMIEDSFSKMVDKIMDKTNERPHHNTDTGKTITVRKSRKTTRKSKKR